VKLTDTPLGRLPITEKVTEEVEPLDKVAVIDDEGLVDPCTTVRLLGEGVDRLKSKVEGATTVKVKVAGLVVKPNGEAEIETTVDPATAEAVAVRLTVALQGVAEPAS
jgi:hypothetical protein